MSDAWPFEDQPDVAVFTSKRVIHEKRPIMWVTHDEDDGAWQFHDGRRVATSDAMLIGLGEIVGIDPTVLELADLPPGWEAWRETPNEPWHRKKSE